MGLGSTFGTSTGTEGGGRVGLHWGDETALDDRFESKRLSPGRFPDLENSAVFALENDVPEVAPTGEAGGLVNVQGSSGEAAWRRRLSPRHRAAVQEFFSHSKGN